MSSDELRSSLFVAQYQAVREVVLHARQNQHSIVSWSLAAAGVLLASGAVLAGDGEKALTSGTPGLAFLVVFGVALPALAAISFNSWIGEVARMRRAAWFLRELEYNVNHKGGPGWPPWPVYDTVVAKGPGGKGDSVTRVGRLAVALLYGGLYVFSSVIAVVAAWSYDFSDRLSPHLEIVGTVGSAVAACWFAWAVFKGFATIAEYAEVKPSIHDATYFADHEA